MRSSNLLILLAVLTAYTCKEVGKNEAKQTTAPVKVETSEDRRSFYVLINAKVLKDDVFEVYYYEPGSATFSSKDFVYKRVAGRQEFQDIKIDLPNDIFPERLRLDMGKNKNQDIMVLNKVEIVWEDKKYEFTKDEIAYEFKPSKYMSYNEDTFQIETKVIDGKYDPYFYTKKLNNIIDYLLED